MVKNAVDKILELIPDHIGVFEGTEYPLPVRTTILGDEEISLTALKQDIKDKQDGDVKNLLEPILLAAELVEASMEDKAAYFVMDQDLQSYVFMGSKWRAGWVLVLGRKNQIGLIDELIKRNFMVFTDTPDVPDTCFIGSRDTSPVYFLQMMLRYGLVWGRIAPGDDHEMGHFLDRDLPGLIVITEDLPDLKYLIVLGLMKLGAPAVVPSSFPFPYGTRVVADSIDEIIAKGLDFPNLRIKFFLNEEIRLPYYCNRAYVNEKLEKSSVMGGTGNSFFCVRPAENTINGLHVYGNPFTGIGMRVDETPSGIGMLIEIQHESISDDMAYIVEQTALKSINYIKGVNAREKHGIFEMNLEEGKILEPEEIWGAVYNGIRLQYPALENISLAIILDDDSRTKMVDEIHEYKIMRNSMVKNMTEENTGTFCVCIECRPFSLEHSCILTPDRIPMCASRTYFTVKAEALFGVNNAPYQRKTEKDIPLKLVFDKGTVIDGEKGEYGGCNAIYERMTRGKLKRVYLHSIRNYPQTSCGCFQNLAFWMDEVQGIGIMSRSSKAITPDGRSWSMLANYAGGKQSDGITGVSLNYILSDHFLKGDGGIQKVVWVDSELYGKIEGIIPKDNKIATEKDVSNLEELKDFLRS